MIRFGDLQTILALATGSGTPAVNPTVFTSSVVDLRRFDGFGVFILAQALTSQSNAQITTSLQTATTASTGAWTTKYTTHCGSASLAGPSGSITKILCNTGEQDPYWRVIGTTSGSAAICISYFGTKHDTTEN